MSVRLPSEPLVSVRTITYNHAPYIRQCIEGILAQRTSFPFEYIIGEDCSTDGTREIVQEYAARHPQRIRLITSEQNVGARANSARVRAACRGKYVAPCEGDDYWHNPDKLQQQVDYLEAHPECGMVHTDADFLYVKDGRRLAAWHRQEGMLKTEGGLFMNLLARTYRVITCTVCARADAFERAQSEPSFVEGRNWFVMGDTPIWLELARRMEFGYLDTSTATYRVLPESATNSDDPAKKLRFWMGMLAMRHHYMEHYPVPDEARQAIVTPLARHLLHMVARGGIAQSVAEVSELLKRCRYPMRAKDRLFLRCGENRMLRWVYGLALHTQRWRRRLSQAESD